MSRRAITIDAGHNGARYALATSLIRLGQTEEGKRELEIFQRLQTEAMASAQRQSELKAVKLDASRRLANGELRRPLRSFGRRSPYDPNAAGALRDLGGVLIKTRQFADAVEVLDWALRLEDTADGHQLLANAFKALGRSMESDAQSALATRSIERVKGERLRKIGGNP